MRDGHGHPGHGWGGEISDRLGALRAELRRIGPLVVAFSGGADSAFLAWVATDTLGARSVRCVTAVSPSLAPEELEDCRVLAREWELDYREVTTTELSDPAYVANGGSRCYHCKASLMTALVAVDAAVGNGFDPALSRSTPESSERGPGTRGSTRESRRRGSNEPERGNRTVVLGVNLDDLDDHRPGQQAAAERGALFPLVTAGFTKADVRAVSRVLGLRTWDKPAAACLASRIPYGTPVTVGTLRSVAQAESGLRALGFRRLRVRHYGDTARLEVPVEDFDAVVACRQAISDAVHRAGYRYVTLDLDGLRSGNLNQALEQRGAASPGGPANGSTSGTANGSTGGPANGSTGGPANSSSGPGWAATSGVRS